MLETAVCYDQLDVPSIAVAELMVRQIQTIEERLKDKFTNNDDHGIEYSLMTGLPSCATLCICPALSAFVATEAAKETAVLKERRKAREERALVRPDPKKKG